MTKKIISILLVVVTLFSICSLSASAATKTNAFDVLTSSKYAKVYTILKSGTTIPYTSKYLTKRGTTSGASNSAYIDNASDELYLLDVGTTNGTNWAYVSFPIGSGKRRNAYINLAAITTAKYEKNHTYYASSKGKFYCSPRRGGSTSSSYYVDSGDAVYLLYTSSTSGAYCQIMYPVSGGKWRIAWCSYENVKKYLNGTSSSSTNETLKALVKKLQSRNNSSFNPVWPCKNSNYISTMYRYYNGGNPKNHGVRSNIYNAFDVAGTSGDTIYSIEQGTVVDKGYQSNGFGYYVTIKHSNGLYSLYGHLKRAACVDKGATVNKQQVIGYMGTTGNSSGNHLHFELYSPNDYKKVVNPWTTYYQGKVSVVVGGNSYRANINYKNDSYAQNWCRWLKNNCRTNSSGDYVYYA